MKKFLAVLAILAFCSVPVLAEEAQQTQEADQTVKNVSSFLGINLEKKPTKEDGKQVVKNEKSFLFINVVINGKTKYTDDKEVK